LVAGKLLGLTEGQLENAVGISGCHGMVLGILDTAAEEYSMTKNIRFPFTAHEDFSRPPCQTRVYGPQP